MQHTIKLILLTLLICMHATLISQKKVRIEVQSQYLVSSKDNLQPHYQYSNKWGIASPFEQSQALLLAGFKYNLLDKDNIQLKVGASGVVKNRTEDSFLHEVYLNGKFFNTINFSIGKHAYSPVSYNDRITVGGFMRNANARPIPRVQIGIFDYKPVGFLNNVIEVKGGLSHGLLNDDRTASRRPNSANNVQVHEKWVYTKKTKGMIQPYAGLFHAALIGGERINGEKIKIDYWATFLGKGSEKVGGGEATNVAGGHDGFWDFGFYHKNSFGKFQFYLQKPFADGTGLRLWRFRNHDYKIGVLAELSKCKFITNVSVELFKTDYQAGSGLPDPIYPKDHPKGHPKGPEIIFIKDIDDYDAFMKENFNVKTIGYDRYDFAAYLEENFNNGRGYGERDDYNNNGTYYNAWTYHGQAMGLPLYHTYNQAKAYAPNWNANNRVVFMNNRVKGFHLGIDGNISDEYSYTIKTTISNNFGSYGEEYIRRYSWEKDPEFFYAGGKKQFYSYFGLMYQNKNWKNVSVQGSLSIDSGELYDALGCSLGLKYSPSVNL